MVYGAYLIIWAVQVGALALVYLYLPRKPHVALIPLVGGAAAFSIYLVPWLEARLAGYPDLSPALRDPILSWLVPVQTVLTALIVGAARLRGLRRTRPTD